MSKAQDLFFDWPVTRKTPDEHTTDTKLAGCKFYPTMKGSGVEWLGNVPKHWDVRRLRNVTEMRVSNVDKHVKKGETSVRLCNYVDVYKNDHISKKMDFMEVTATPEEIKRFRLEKDDVLITKDSETWDDIGVPALVTEPAMDLISGYHLALFRPYADKLSGGYMLRALQSKGLAYQFHVEAKGVTRYGLSHSGIKSAWMPLPPLPEQTAIVRYLDYVDRRVRRFVRAKEKLIGLLGEQKQVIIHRAVTRGLDPDVSLKPSGVEWLGEVPEHWEVFRLKGGVSNIIEQTNECSTDDIYVALENVESWTGKLHGIEPDIIFDSQVKRFRLGDVLFGKLRPYLAKTTRPNQSGVCVGEFLVLRPRSTNLSPSYLEHFIRSKPTIDAISASTFGAKMPRADWQFIGSMKQLLPPLPEQTAIVEYLDKATADIDTAITRANREVELLNEYRTRLIADVVTGKLDVREAAAQLPDEAGEDNALTDPEEDTTEELEH